MASGSKTPEANHAERAVPSAGGDRELTTIAAFASRLLNRKWFDGRFEADAQPFMARLLIGVFLCYERGTLPTKRQAMRYMSAVDARTSQRYIALAEEHGLLRVFQSTLDKRIDLLCPSEALLKMMRGELAELANLVRLVVDMIDNWTDWGFNLSNRFPSSQIEGLLADQELPDYSETSLSQRIARYDEIIRLAPENAAAWRARGEAHAMAGDKKAIADFTEAIRLNPHNPELYYRRGRAYRDSSSVKEDLFDLAVADFSELIRLAPKYPDGYNLRGEVLGYLGERKKAKADLDTGAKLTIAQRNHSLRPSKSYVTDFDEARRVADELEKTSDELDLAIGRVLLQNHFGSKPFSDSELVAAAERWLASHIEDFRKALFDHALIRSYLSDKATRLPDKGTRDQLKFFSAVVGAVRLVQATGELPLALITARILQHNMQEITEQTQPT
jgi:hypothetical protein